MLVGDPAREVWWPEVGPCACGWGIVAKERGGGWASCAYFSTAGFRGRADLMAALLLVMVVSTIDHPKLVLQNTPSMAL